MGKLDPIDCRHRQRTPRGVFFVRNEGKRKSSGRQPLLFPAAQWRCREQKASMAARAACKPVVISSGSLSAAFPVIRMSAGGFGLRFRHVLSLFGLAVVPRAGAVIDIGRRVHPDHTGTAAGRLCHVGCAGRFGGGSGSSGGSSGGCTGRRGRRWRSAGGWRCGRLGRVCRGCRSGCVRYKPLYAFVTVAGTGLLWSIGVTAVFALPGRAGGSLRGAAVTYRESQCESDDAALNFHPTPRYFRFGGESRIVRRHLNKAQDDRGCGSASTNQLP
jgi:hypothetical protein